MLGEIVVAARPVPRPATALVLVMVTAPRDAVVVVGGEVDVAGGPVVVELVVVVAGVVDVEDVVVVAVGDGSIAVRSTGVAFPTGPDLPEVGDRVEAIVTAPP